MIWEGERLVTVEDMEKNFRSQISDFKFQFADNQGSALETH